MCWTWKEWVTWLVPKHYSCVVGGLLHKMTISPFISLKIWRITFFFNKNICWSHLQGTAHSRHSAHMVQYKAKILYFFLFPSPFLHYHYLLHYSPFPCRLPQIYCNPHTVVLSIDTLSLFNSPSDVYSCPPPLRDAKEG